MDPIWLVPPPGLAAAEAAAHQEPAGDPVGRLAGLVAGELATGELATGGWPGRARLDRPDLILLCDPTGLHALANAGSRVLSRQGTAAHRLSPTPWEFAALLDCGGHARIDAG